MRIRIGTRASALARTQTATIATALQARGHETETLAIRTAGDKDRSRAFADIGAPGLFVREIEDALQSQRIDLAVHSYKDLPSDLPQDLTIAAVPERADPADRLIVRPMAHDSSADPLPLAAGARVGTASARRAALLGNLRPDLCIETLRGNVPTRLKRLKQRDFDAIVLAAAGLDRLAGSAYLGESESVSTKGLVDLRLDPELFTPAPTQGALALQIRATDEDLAAVLADLHDQEASAPLTAERKMLALVDGGCQLPFGAWCRRRPGGGFLLDAVIEKEGALRRVRCAGDDPLELAARAWEALRNAARDSP